MLINLIKLIFIGNIVFFNNVVANDLIEFSSIKQGEDSKFLHPSVRKYGDRVRFEVLIGIVNIDNMQSDIPVTRKLRFLTDCENKKFALMMSTPDLFLFLSMTQHQSDYAILARSDSFKAKTVPHFLRA